MIDTWNVLHQTGILPPESAGIEVRGLVSLLNSSRWSMERITFICDGTPSENSAHGPKYQTVFTGANRSADDEIMGRVASSSSAREIIVVTSDREIIRSIKANGAKHLNSAVFLQILIEDNKAPKKKRVHRPSGLSAELADQWKREFGIDEQALQELQDTPLPTLQKQESVPKEKPKVKQQRNAIPEPPILPPDLLEEARNLINQEARRYGCKRSQDH